MGISLWRNRNARLCKTAKNVDKMPDLYARTEHVDVARPALFRCGMTCSTQYKVYWPQWSPRTPRLQDDPHQPCPHLKKQNAGDLSPARQTLAQRLLSRVTAPKQSSNTTLMSPTGRAQAQVSSWTLNIRPPFGVSVTVALIPAGCRPTYSGRKRRRRSASASVFSTWLIAPPMHERLPAPKGM